MSTTTTTTATTETSTPDVGLPTPALDRFTIYTKQNCGYCKRAKELLTKDDPLIVECDEVLAYNRDGYLKWIDSLTPGVQHRTFPMIFHNGKFIGGFSDVETFYATLPKPLELSEDF